MVDFVQNSFEKALQTTHVVQDWGSDRISYHLAGLPGVSPLFFLCRAATGGEGGVRTEVRLDFGAHCLYLTPCCFVGER